MLKKFVGIIYFIEMYYRNLQFSPFFGYLPTIFKFIHRRTTIQNKIILHDAYVILL